MSEKNILSLIKDLLQEKLIGTKKWNLVEEDEYILLIKKTNGRKFKISVGEMYGLDIDLPEYSAPIDDIIFGGNDELFKELIKTSNVYFEYGCGKSTEYVYQNTDARIYSVDTSKEWVHRIDKKSDRMNIFWVDVGDVTSIKHVGKTSHITHGTPTSFTMRHNFIKYAEILWEKNIDPDLVLIDGRFRVLCFLNSLKYAPIGTKILFDDYEDRPFYHVAEDFCKKLDVCGRQALFEVDKRAKELISDSVIKSFENVIG